MDRSEGNRLQRLRRLAVVDYIQLVRPTDPRASREQQVATVSREIQTLARSLEFSVVILAQLNRNSQSRADKRPVLADLRESGSLEQDPDVVLLLDRPATYEDGCDVSYGEINVAKNRDGATGTVVLEWHPHIFEFVQAESQTPRRSESHRQLPDWRD